MTQTTKKYITTKDNIRIYYEKYDVDHSLLVTNQTPLLFVHGMGGDLDAWHFVRDSLLDKGYSSIAFDLRGHGNSTHPRQFDKYKMDSFVEDIIDIMDAEHINTINLIGHSYGSLVATYFALKYPERVNKLVLISIAYQPPKTNSRSLLKKIRIALINAIAFIGPPPFKAGHSDYPIGKFHKDYEWFGIVRTVTRNSLRSYFLTIKEVEIANLEDTLDRLNMPTLVIVGEKDSIFPLPISKKVHEHIPGSLFKIVPDANHVVILNNAQEVTEMLLEFLS